MKNLKEHITEAWGSVKKQSNKAKIEAWCDEMGIEKYTINSKGEIDVNGKVDLEGKDFEELPYKFGTVKWFFSVEHCKNLKSLKNCPDKVGTDFYCNWCPKLESLEGCPKKVGRDFICNGCSSLKSLEGITKNVEKLQYGGCGKKFDNEYIKQHCNVDSKIYN